MSNENSPDLAKTAPNEDVGAKGNGQTEMTKSDGPSHLCGAGHTFDPNKPPYRSGWRDYFIYPFRIFFLLIAATVPLGALFWPALYAGAPFPVEGISFHATVFINVVGGAAFTGFLFTALPEWTHWKKNLFQHGLTTFIIWLAGTILVFFSMPVSMVVFTLLWFYLFFFAVWVCVKMRDDRQISIILMLPLMPFLEYWFIATGDYAALRSLVHAFMIGISIVVFRVGKAMAQEALDRLKLEDCFFVPNPFHRNITIISLWALIGAELFLDPVTAGWLSMAVGFTFLGRLRDYHHTRLLRAYYVRWIYMVMLLAGLGYVWRGLSIVAGVGDSTAAFHLITIGSFLLMVMMVMLIAGRIHSSLELVFIPRMRVALVMVVLAAVSRSLLTSLGWNYEVFAIYGPGILVSMAFLLYISPFWVVFRDNEALPVE